MPDVWINLAHVYFAQGNFALAVKMVNLSLDCTRFFVFKFILPKSLWQLSNADDLFYYVQYQNCLRKFYHNTDSQILLYLARTHYEAEQWQDCIKTLLRAIHLAPSNYTLRFDAGVAMQKFSASTLQKAKRTADEVLFFIRWLYLSRSVEVYWRCSKTLVESIFTFSYFMVLENKNIEQNAA